MLKKAYRASRNHCLSSTLSPFIEYLHAGRKRFNNPRNSNELVLEDDWYLLDQILPDRCQVKCLKSSKYCIVVTVSVRCIPLSFYVVRVDRLFFIRIVLVDHHGLVLSIKNASKSKTFTDACVVYEDQGKVKYGIIEKMFHVHSSGSTLLKIQSLQNARFDSFAFNCRRFTNENIIYGNLSSDATHIVPVDSIIEKACLYEGKDLTYFARFPNLYESS